MEPLLHLSAKKLNYGDGLVDGFNQSRQYLQIKHRGLLPVFLTKSFRFLFFLLFMLLAYIMRINLHYSICSFMCFLLKVNNFSQIQYKPK